MESFSYTFQSLCGQFLLHILYVANFSCTFFMWPVSLAHSLCGQFLLHIPKFMWAVSITHSLCGQFLLHIPNLCGQFLLHILYAGSFSYTFQGYVGSRFSYTFFMWAVSLTPLMWPVSLTHSKVYVGSFSYTFQSVCGQFLLHILCVASFSYTFQSL